MVKRASKKTIKNKPSTNRSTGSDNRGANPQAKNPSVKRVARNWDGLRDAFARFADIGAGLAYRGQCADFGDGKLLASLDRVRLAGPDPHEGVRKLERVIWDKFLRDAPCSLSPYELRSFDDAFFRWPLMRHRGILTRLLDWTESIWIAAYFASVDIPEHDGVIWGFNRKEFDERNHAKNKAETARVLEVDSPSNRPLLLDTKFSPWVCQLIRTGPSFPNMLRQQGFFTIGGRVGVDHWHAIQDVFSKDEVQKCTWEMVIPKALKPRVLRYLDGMGINGTTLFEGIEGVARSLNAKAAMLGAIPESDLAVGSMPMD